MANFTRWIDFADSRRLDFRTLCNNGAGAAGRPISPGLANRIANRDDAEMLFQLLFDDPRNPPDADRILKTMSGDARWQTIVTESIDTANREQQQRAEQAALFSKFWAWFTKTPANGTASPAEKTAGTAVAGLTAGIGATGALVIAVTFSAKDHLVIPVSLQRPADDHLALNLNVTPTSVAGIEPLKLTIEPSIKDGKIPIEVSTKTEPIPLRFSKGDLDALNNIGRAAMQAADSVQKAGNVVTPQMAANFLQKLEDVRSVLADIQQQDQRSAEYVQPLAKALSTIADTLEKQAQPARLQALTDQLEQTGKAINRLGGGRTLTTLAALENQETQVQVDWQNDGGVIESCEVKVVAGKIGRTADIRKMRVKCGDSTEREIPLGDGASQARAGSVVRPTGLAFGLAVDAIQRPVFGPNVAILRVFATASGSGTAPANDVRRTASK